MNNHQILAKIIILYRINTYVMMYTKRYRYMYIIPLIIWNNTERYIHLWIHHDCTMEKHYHVRKTKSPPTNYSSESFNLCATTCTMKLNINIKLLAISSRLLSLLRLLQIKASLLLSRILVRFENSIKSNKSWFKS